MFSNQQAQSHNPNKPLDKPTTSIVLALDKDPTLPNRDPGTPLQSGAAAPPASPQQETSNHDAQKRSRKKSGVTPDAKNSKPMDERKKERVVIPFSVDDDEAAAVATATETSDGATVSAFPDAGEMAASLGAEPVHFLPLSKEIVDPRTIHAGTPRSGIVVESFEKHRYYDESDKSDRGLQLFWQAKHTKFVRRGYTSLIGEVATYIDRHFKEYTSDYDKVYTRTSIKKFKKSGDIQTYDGPYREIIRFMFNNNECTLATAKVLLESLSLPQQNGKVEPKDEPTELKINHGQTLFSKLFDEKGNPKSAQKLMGALICEAIRFQEDGALARMAIRAVMSLFPKGIDPNSQIEPMESNPFYQVFVDGENPVVFAKEGGKRVTLNLFFNPSMNQSFSQLSAFMHETSDVDEEGSSQETAINPPEPQTSSFGRVIIPKVPDTTPRDKRPPQYIPPTSYPEPRKLMDEFSAEEAEVKEEDKDSTTA